jgi:hypothetical protein
VCFIVHKTTSKLERAILATLYLVGVKNTDTLLIMNLILLTKANYFQYICLVIIRSLTYLLIVNLVL